MKITLEFDSTDEPGAAEQALSAPRAFSALWDIQQKVFRPARKHGYSGNEYAARLNELGEKPDVTEAIGLLETLFCKVLEDNDVDLNLMH